MINPLTAIIKGHRKTGPDSSPYKAILELKLPQGFISGGDWILQIHSLWIQDIPSHDEAFLILTSNFVTGTIRTDVPEQILDLEETPLEIVHHFHENTKGNLYNFSSLNKFLVTRPSQLLTFTITSSTIIPMSRTFGLHFTLVKIV